MTAHLLYEELSKQIHWIDQRLNDMETNGYVNPAFETHLLTLKATYTARLESIVPPSPTSGDSSPKIHTRTTARTESPTLHDPLRNTQTLSNLKSKRFQKVSTSQRLFPKSQQRPRENSPAANRYNSSSCEPDPQNRVDKKVGRMQVYADNLFVPTGSPSNPFWEEHQKTILKEKQMNVRQTTLVKCLPGANPETIEIVLRTLVESSK